MNHKPQKRHKALQPLSREHHHGLLLSWKIRAGFSKNIEPKRIKVYADHRRLKRLFTESDDEAKTLSKIEEELDKHIRFEERVLFPEIQKAATEKQLALIEEIHQDDDFIDKLDDAFWL